MTLSRLALFPALLLSLLGCTSGGQDALLTGDVFDFLDNQPVAGVSICDTGADRCATTDAAGYFELEFRPGSETWVTLSKEGYPVTYLGVTADHLERDPHLNWGFADFEAIDLLADAVDETWEPGTGAVQFAADIPNVVPRRGRAGMTFEFTGSDEIFYFDVVGLPSATLEATSAKGQAGAINVPPGDYVVTVHGADCVARNGIDGPSPSSALVHIAADAVTYVSLQCE